MDATAISSGASSVGLRDMVDIYSWIYLFISMLSIFFSPPSAGVLLSKGRWGLVLDRIKMEVNVASPLLGILLRFHCPLGWMELLFLCFLKRALLFYGDRPSTPVVNWAIVEDWASLKLWIFDHPYVPCLSPPATFYSKGTSRSQKPPLKSSLTVLLLSNAPFPSSLPLPPHLSPAPSSHIRVAT